MSLDEYAAQTTKYREITLRCAVGHDLRFKITSLRNKIKSFEAGKVENMCATCIKPPSKEEQRVKERCVVLGYQFVRFDRSCRRVAYLCECGAENQSHAANLLKPERKGQCPKCQGSKSRTKIEDLRVLFEENGCELLDTEYKNKDTPLRFRCECGREGLIRYGLLKRGARCRGCKSERARVTTREKYGVDNVSQVTEFKEKGKVTTLEKYGEDHCMKVPAIREQAEKTCLEKYGTRWAFTQPDVYEKAKSVMLERHGVEYGLQSKEIRKKCTETCQERYGVNRPMESEIFREKGKDTLEERYGVRHPLQHPPFFYKSMGSPNRGNKIYEREGKTWTVQGYEDRCIKDLINSGKAIDSIIVGTDGVPFCRYTFEEKGCMWYPDIWLSDEQIIIEVKSTWTYNKDPKRMKYKMICCPYVCELWIYSAIALLEVVEKDKKGNISYRMDSGIKLGKSIDKEVQK